MWCKLQNKLTTIEPYILFLCRCLRCWTVAMDADQASRKRGVLLNYDKCIICQEDNKQPNLATPTSDGLKTIHHTRQVWLKLRNDNFRSATDRLTDALAACPSPLIVCHNGCGASYTSSHTLERLSDTDTTVDQIQSSSSAPTAVAQSQ
jgi:hypothetical protein